MKLAIPDPALVLLVGPSGAGKSTFAAAHFKPTEILSSDSIRAALTDDPADQEASAEAFRVLNILVNGRLKRRLTTVIDATNLRAASRKGYARVAARHGIQTVVIAFDFPHAAYAAHNLRRPDRVVDDEVVANQASRMREVLATIPLEGHAARYVLRDPAAISNVVVERNPVAGQSTNKPSATFRT